MKRLTLACCLAMLLTAPVRADGIAASDPSIVSWATGVVNLARGPQDITNSASPLATFGTATNALGHADGTLGVVSLGDGGQITLSFARPIANGAGADFAVFENGFTFNGGIFGELAFVEVSEDGTNFVRFPSISQTQTTTQVGAFDPLNAADIHNLAGQYPALFGTLFDLSDVGLDCVQYVRVVDVVGSIDPRYGSLDSQGHLINDPFTTPFAGGGFDLDAVGVIHECPAPPSALLLGIGAATGVGLYWLRRGGRRTVMAGVMLALLLALPARADEAVKKDTQALQGTWSVVDAEKDGKAFERIKGGTMTIKDGTFAIKTKSGTEMEGDLTLDPAKTPKTLDMLHQKGPLREKKWQAIYSVEGDDLKLCYVELEEGKEPERPKEFKTAAEDGRLLIVLKRAKK